MLEDVVKRDNVDLGLVWKVLGKVPGYYRQTILARLSRQDRIRFDAGGIIAAPGCRLNKPAMRAANVQETGGRIRAEPLDFIQDALEIEMTEAVQRLSAAVLVDGIVAGVITNGG